MSRMASRQFQVKEGCEDSSRTACEAGHRLTCEFGCQFAEDPEACRAECLAVPICEDVYPDDCRRCEIPCNDALKECYDQCPTCETDPDGLECVVCQEKCHCANLSCLVDNCASRCNYFQTPAPPANSVAFKNAFASKRGLMSSRQGVFPAQRAFRQSAFNAQGPRQVAFWNQGVSRARSAPAWSARPMAANGLFRRDRIRNW